MQTLGLSTGEVGSEINAYFDISHLPPALFQLAAYGLILAFLCVSRRKNAGVACLSDFLGIFSLFRQAFIRF